MSILNVVSLQPTGLVDVNPYFIYINTSDTYTQVTTTGYLNREKQNGFVFNNNQMALVKTSDDGVILLQIKVTNTDVSLIAIPVPGQVILPTIANHIATYTNTTGTLSEDPATAISAGNIQAGLTTGTSGVVYSCPGTTTTGRLGLAAAASAGAFDVLISNASYGQASTLSFADVGSATGQFLVKTAALVSGNFPQNSGTAGLMIDSGLAVSNIVSKTAANTFSGSGQIILAKANGTEAANAVTASGNAGVITTSSLSTAGGASYAITWTNTKITTASSIFLSIMGGTNTTQNITFTVTAGSGTSTLTIFNNTAATALNGTILIGYTVL